MGSHSEILIFIVLFRMEWPLVLGPTWLKLWNPQVDWKKGTLRLSWDATAPDNGSQQQGGGPQEEVATALKDELW